MEVELYFIKTKNNIPQTVNFNNFHGMGIVVEIKRQVCFILLILANISRYAPDSRESRRKDSLNYRIKSLRENQWEQRSIVITCQLQ